MNNHHSCAVLCWSPSAIDGFPHPGAHSKHDSSMQYQICYKIMGKSSLQPNLMATENNYGAM